METLRRRKTSMEVAKPYAWDHWFVVDASFSFYLIL